MTRTRQTSPRTAGARDATAPLLLHRIPLTANVPARARPFAEVVFTP
jgi:hypothetical protein